MASTNPYIQAWSSEAGGSSSGAFFPTLVPQVSTAPTPDFITFHITSFNPTILNSTIYAPHSRPFLQVTTQERVTRLTDHAGSCIALIEWARNPIVEIKDSVPRLYAGAWLKLSQDNLLVDFCGPLFACLTYLEPRYRSMAHGDDKYKWIPSGPYVLVGSDIFSAVIIA